MKIFESKKELIAREDIELGDAVVLLWKNYARRATSSSAQVFGFCGKKVKKGEKFIVFNKLR